MNTIYMLVICIGILWNGECEVVRKFQYPTLEACQAEQVRAKQKINDGYAVCVEVEQIKKKEVK